MDIDSYILTNTHDFTPRLTWSYLTTQIHCMSLHVQNRQCRPCCVSCKSDSHQALQESPSGPAMNSVVLICDTFRRHWTSGRDKRGKLRSWVEVYCLRSEASFDISTPRSHRSAWADSPEVQNENGICRYGMIWICLEFDCFVLFLADTWLLHRFRCGGEASWWCNCCWEQVKRSKNGFTLMGSL